MELEEFYEQVEDRLDAALDVDAGEATHSVLAALAQRLEHDDAVELGSELPESLSELLAAASGERSFDRDGFIEDVADRLDLDDVDAERVAVAVLGAVRSAIEPGVETDEVIESLPADLAQLMQPSE